MSNLEVDNIVLKVESTDEKSHIIVKFNPYLKLTTDEKYPTIDLFFPRGLGLRNTTIYDDEMQKSQSFKISEIETEILDFQKFLHFSKPTCRVQIKHKKTVVNTTCNLKEAQDELKRLVIQSKDFREFKEEDLIAVSMTNKEYFEQSCERRRLVRSKFWHASRWKATVHFTLNHVVTAHGAKPEGWRDTNAAILTPFKQLKKSNITFYGGHPADIFFVGFVKLPKETEIIYRERGETWEKYVARIEQRINEKGFKVMKGSDNGWGVNSEDENAWLERIGKDWQTFVNHMYTPFGRIEKPLLEKDDPDTETAPGFREKFLIALHHHYPIIFIKYKKILKAWDSYWRIKGL
ncbi:hypothetical protein HOD38_00195 [archaeon]|jgi:hypothetical protein|nr:hypothetical protein [archaeon]MBT4396666.1 hypothetical protein [archaeon]MBT4441276.1 hypothetical protein [archaeon]